MFKKIFPPIETTLDLEPEELAPFVLKHLKQIGKINRYNYTLGTSPEMVIYAGQHLEEFKKQPVCKEGEEIPVKGNSLKLEPRSLVVLIEK